MTRQISALGWVPDSARGYVKDLRVRWALEEAGLSYSSVLIEFDRPLGDPYRAWQPFGQVPAYRDEEVELFESGAILLYLAARSPVLAPEDPAGRARMASWVFAATTSLQPQADVHNLLGRVLTEEGRQQVRQRLERRLAGLSDWLGDKDYLEGRFTVGDLMMATVLRELTEDGFLGRFPNLAAYHARCEARPAFGRALAAQLADFRDVS